jgi:hypothetical protein
MGCEERRERGEDFGTADSVTKGRTPTRRGRSHRTEQTYSESYFKGSCPQFMSVNLSMTERNEVM